MLDVPCPACAPAHISLEVIAESQRLLDERGPCLGLASFECPALYFAALAPPVTLTHPRAAPTDDERDLARWEGEGGACRR